MTGESPTQKDVQRSLTEALGESLEYAPDANALATVTAERDAALAKVERLTRLVEDYRDHLLCSVQDHPGDQVALDEVQAALDATKED